MDSLFSGPFQQPYCETVSNGTNFGGEVACLQPCDVLGLEGGPIFGCFEGQCTEYPQPPPVVFVPGRGFLEATAKWKASRPTALPLFPSEPPPSREGLYLHPFHAKLGHSTSPQR